MGELIFAFLFFMLGIWLLFINLAAAIIVAVDKHLSKKPRGSVRRVPEKSFVMLSALGGGCGTLLLMFLIRHKTRSHNLLLLKISLFTALWAVLILAILKYF